MIMAADPRRQAWVARSKPCGDDRCWRHVSREYTDA